MPVEPLASKASDSPLPDSQDAAADQGSTRVQAFRQQVEDTPHQNPTAAAAAAAKTEEERLAEDATPAAKAEEECLAQEIEVGTLRGE